MFGAIYFTQSDPFCPSSHPTVFYSICISDEGTGDVSVQLTCIATGARRQDFTLGLFGSKVLLFSTVHVEKLAQVHMMGYGKTTLSSYSN